MYKIKSKMDLSDENSNTKPKPIIKCPKCPKTFKYKSRLTAHLYRKTPCNFILELKDTKTSRPLLPTHYALRASFLRSPGLWF